MSPNRPPNRIPDPEQQITTTGDRPAGENLVAFGAFSRIAAMGEIFAARRAGAIAETMVTDYAQARRDEAGPG